MIKPVLLDTGFIVALLDQSESQHRSSVDTVKQVNRPLITCEAVIAETLYLLRLVPGAAKAVLENITRQIFHLPWRLTGNEERMSTLMERYREVPMDFADSCLVCMAEHFGTGDILTLDSDFYVYRWKKRSSFNILNLA